MVTGRLPTKFLPAERASEKQVAEQARQFDQRTVTRMLLDSVPDVLLILNPQRQVVFANELCLNLLDMPSLKQIYGQRPGELFGCVHSDEMPGGCGTSEACQTCGAARAIQSGLAGRIDSRECRILRKDGEALDLQVSTRPLEASGGQYVVFTMQDISDLKRRRALERIFFHDVLNTVNLVYGYSQLIELKPEGVDEFIGDLNRAVVRLTDEINAQRQLLAAESGELKPSEAAVNPVEILQELARQYRASPLADECAIRVVQTVTGVTLKTDAALLGRVLGNMIKNALEASTAGDTIVLRVISDGETVTYSVNNPAVMPRDVQLQVFNRSFSTKGSGRGLGTYSIKMLTERYLHGRVWFTSASGEGTTFYAQLPLASTTSS
jgi:signal transduction histidine kinase